jgi:hypothetical protein
MKDGHTLFGKYMKQAAKLLHKSGILAQLAKERNFLIQMPIQSAHPA